MQEKWTSQKKPSKQRFVWYVTSGLLLIIFAIPLLLYLIPAWALRHWIEWREWR